MSDTATVTPHPSVTPGVGAVNRRFYESLWSDGVLIAPERFGTWSLIAGLAARAPRRLEIGPGLRPRSPILGTHFLDLDQRALGCLAGRGGLAAQADLACLPWRDDSFDLVVALDVLEHVERDALALGEIARILRPGGSFVVSTPLFAARWTEFDRVVGHQRRYEPTDLMDLIAGRGFCVERSAVLGLQPRSTWLSRIGAWWLEHRAEQALWWYRRFLPLAVRFDAPPTLHDGLVDTAGVDEILLVCRRCPRR